MTPSASRVRRPTPHDEGFLWPAEWARHEGTWLAWPHDPTTWGDGLAEVEDAYESVIRAIAEGETVHLLVKDAAMQNRVRKRLGGVPRVRLHRVATRDGWIRDYGPIVVARGRGKARRRLALDFGFNAWGGKYKSLIPDDAIPQRVKRIHTLPTRKVDLVLEGGSIEGNGKGTLLTSEQCLLNPNRNPSLNRAEIEGALREYLGARHILWLGEGIAGDDTDGHVDDMTRFVGPTTVLTAVEKDATDANHAPLADNLRRLRAMADQDGRPLDIVELPMPDPLPDGEGGRLPASYANFYIANRVVVVPVFGQKKDARALRILGRLFPRRRLVPIRSNAVVAGLGAWHCLSQQLPA